MVGLRRELVELVLERGSVGLGREPELDLVNHFVGLAKKLDRPEGDAERVIEGNDGEGLTPGWRV